MPTNAKVAIELYVDDQGTLRVRQFRDEATKDFDQVEKAGTGAAGRIQAAWERLKGAWVEITAGILAVREAWNLANMAAKAEQEKQAFASLAASYGANSQQILASLKEVSGGTIDTMTLIRNAGTAMMMGINPNDVIRLLEIARATTKQTGQTTVQAFADISLAVGRQSKMILDNLGIILDVDKANEEYAKTLHKTSAQLTDMERKQAFMNATMKAGGELMDKLGKQTNTNADKLERWTAKINDYKLIVGDLVVRLLNFVDGTFNSIGAGSLYISGGIFKIVEGVTSLTDKLHLSSGAAAEWKMSAEAAFGAAGELVDKANQSFEDMKSSNDVITHGQAFLKKQIEDTTKAMEEQEKKRKEILDQQKAEAEEQAAAEREMYEEAGFGAERYFSQEATDLVKKAARWQKAGADIYSVEQWLYDQLGKLSADAWTKGETAAGQAMDAMQAQSRTLVDQYNQANTTIVEQLKAVGVEVQQLNGQNIGITASFDGGMLVTGIDTAIAKMQQLQTAASSAIAAASASPSSPAQGSYENTDSSMSAAEVAATESSYYSGKNAAGVTVNINQQMSRSDVTSIISEQRRREDRK